jgi:hypothetical protein
MKRGRAPREQATDARRHAALLNQMRPHVQVRLRASKTNNATITVE